MKEKLYNKHFDVIYDFLCYSPKNAKDIIKCVSTDKYIMISSYLVYGWGININEDDFQAEKYEYIDADIETLQKIVGFKPAYVYGKRGGEAVIAGTSEFEEVRVRFPIILGTEDHLKRMDSYVCAIMNERELYTDNLDCKFSVIQKESAAKWLCSLKDINCKGAINIADKNELSICELINRIEILVGKKANIGSKGIIGGYNSFYNLVMNLEKAKMINHKLMINKNDYIDQLIRDIYDQYI